MPETPLELGFVRETLHSAFSTRLPAATSGNEVQRERDLLSRALAAYAVHTLAGCPLEDAAAAVVDGGDDGGVDAVHVDTAGQRLWVVQSKFISTGHGEPDLGSVTKFKAGIEALLTGQFVGFASNAAWRAKLPAVERALNGEVTVRGVLVYTGVNAVSEDRRRAFDDLRRRFGAETLEIETYNLTSVHDWATGASVAPGVPEVTLTLHRPGWVRDGFETVYGLLALSDLAELHRQHGPRLVAANIRNYKGRTDVNDRIYRTAREEPEHFMYLNNGLTAYCERIEVPTVERANTERKRVRAFGLSIVNGAQTLGAVARAFQRPRTVRRGAHTDIEPGAAAPDGYVFVRVISLRGCADDRAFAERITRSTNYQNRIDARDFATLDEQQLRIARLLGPAGVTYHYKEGEDTPDPDERNFTLDEATTACACLAQDSDCDLVVRALSNRRSLWDVDRDDPSTPGRSRYERVFRPERSARAVWRAVQVYRLVKETMRGGARSETGVRQVFFENCRWLVLNLVYHDLRPEAGELLTLTPDEQARVSSRAHELAEALWSECEATKFVARDGSAGGEYTALKHLKSVFSSPADCRTLRERMLRRLHPAH